MKKYLPLPLFVFFVWLVSGCSDKIEVTKTYVLYEPVYKALEEVRASVGITDPIVIEKTGKIYLYKNFILLNEPGKGIHIINNQNPSTPAAIKFINIPGNYDMAVKGDILYADSFMDLLAFDISNLNNISLIERVKDLFLSSMYNVYNSEKGVIVDWEEVKTIEVSKDEFGHYPTFFWHQWGGFRGEWGIAFMASDASKSSSAAPSISVGIGGSMARFTIVNNYLYTIDNSIMYTFNISDLRNPSKVATTNMGWGIETIFPYENKLFIGARTGMHIYDISSPASPVQLSFYSHVNSCDPVVVQDTLAYVTLRGGTECQSFSNQLDVINIKDPRSPKLLKTYPMTGPYGLGIDGRTLFICDGKAGLKVYNVVSPFNIDANLIKTYKDIDAYDVIPFNNRLIMIGKDGLYQFDYSDPAKITLLSKILVK
jgi:hypothetical protein